MNVGLVVVVVASVATVSAIPLFLMAVLPFNQRSTISRPKGELSEYRRSELSSSSLERLVQPLLERMLTELVRKVTPTGLIDSTARRLVVADLVAKFPLELVVGVKFVMGLAGFLLTITFIPVDSWGLRIGLAVLSLGIGFQLPDIQIGRIAERRQARIRSELPEVLDQLMVIVEAGLGFDSALGRVVQSTRGPLIDEFARALRSIRLGQTRAEALTSLSERTGVREVQQFVSAVKQADQLGVPLAHILRTQSSHLRELTGLQAEEKAMRLPVKLVFPMVLCMLPALFVTLLGPVAVRVINSGL